MVVRASSAVVAALAERASGPLAAFSGISSATAVVLISVGCQLTSTPRTSPLKRAALAVMAVLANSSVVPVVGAATQDRWGRTSPSYPTQSLLRVDRAEQAARVCSVASAAAAVTPLACCFPTAAKPVTAVQAAYSAASAASADGRKPSAWPPAVQAATVLTAVSPAAGVVRAYRRSVRFQRLEGMAEALVTAAYLAVPAALAVGRSRFLTRSVVRVALVAAVNSGARADLAAAESVPFREPVVPVAPVESVTRSTASTASRDLRFRSSLPACCLRIWGFPP